MFGDLREFVFLVWPVALATYLALGRWGRRPLPEISLILASLLFWNTLSPGLGWRFLLALTAAYGAGQLLVVGFGGRHSRRVLVGGLGLQTLALWGSGSGLEWALSAVFWGKLAAYQWQCYRGRLPVASPTHFATTVLFFPQLIPGLTSSFRDVAPQWRRGGPDGEALFQGLLIFGAGWSLMEMAPSLLPPVALFSAGLGGIGVGVGVARTFGIRLDLIWGTRRVPLDVPVGISQWALALVSFSLVPLVGHWLGAVPLFYGLFHRTQGWGLASWNPTLTAVLALLGIGLFPWL